MAYDENQACSEEPGTKEFLFSKRVIQDIERTPGRNVFMATVPRLTHQVLPMLLGHGY